MTSQKTLSTTQTFINDLTDLLNGKAIDKKGAAKTLGMVEARLQIQSCIKYIKQLEIDKALLKLNKMTPDSSVGIHEVFMYLHEKNKEIDEYESYTEYLEKLLNENNITNTDDEYQKYLNDNFSAARKLMFPQDVTDSEDNNSSNHTMAEDLEYTLSDKR